MSVSADVESACVDNDHRVSQMVSDFMQTSCLTSLKIVVPFPHTFSTDINAGQVPGIHTLKQSQSHNR
jgi:hypothetical protein